MQKQIPHLAFKMAYNNITRVLTTEANVYDFENKNHKAFLAIWDTGATHSVITKKITAQLNLQPTGMTKICGVNNEKDCPTYLINLGLPNKVIIPNLNVAMVDITGADLLIGMDVISQGDFSISNHNKTVFCYSLPPHYKHIDLVERSDKINNKNKLNK